MPEVEAKFRVHPPYRLPELAGPHTGVAAVEEVGTTELRAVYYDTSDLRLAREGVTLRHREGEGEGDGWHLKLPNTAAAVADSNIGSREEIHGVGTNGSPPRELSDLVTAFVRGAALGPVATLVTTRTTYNLANDEGALLAELVDDSVSVENGGHVAGRFREIEIEDRGGGVDVLRRVGASLRAAGAVRGEFVPKVVRALGPQATSEPDPPRPDEINLKAPASAAVRSLLRQHVRQVLARDPAVRRGEPDSVHQLRVSIRRTRSLLKTLGPLLNAEWAESLRSELAWAATGLGRARDSEVLLARIEAALDELPAEHVLGPVRARLRQQLGDDLAAGESEVTATLGSERYVALLDRLVAAAWEPLTSPAADVSAREALPAVVLSTWEQLARRARRLRRAEATVDDWHRTRIAAKQVRYALEAVAPVYGKPARVFAAAVEDVQELLGEHQDAVMTGAALRRLATTSRIGSGAFTLGLLHAGEDRAVERTQADFSGVWRAASRPRLRAWLTT